MVPNFFRIKYLIILLLSNVSASIAIHPQIGLEGTISIPFIVDYSINENLSIHHINRLYSVKHPQLHHFHYKKERSNITAITEISIIKYNKNV